jgi:hypothetical protein
LSYKCSKLIKRQVFGRGGQALLGFISWRVFAKYVTVSMHTAPITFNTFRAFFLNGDTPTVLGVTRLIGDFTRRHALRSKAAMTFMIMTMAFILAFPTFGGAMTGYSANVQAFVEDRAENYVPFDSFQVLYYTIHDGDRINKTVDFQVTSFDARGKLDELPELSKVYGLIMRKRDLTSL